jgi:protein gp37
MADVFELRSDLDPWRTRVWGLIAETPWLDWLLLTKRPQNIEKKVPWAENWPGNVWLGTTVEDQKRAEERVPILLQFPAKYRFLSCEPLIGQVDLGAWTPKRHPSLHRIDWVIAGGESGPNARVMLPGWARSLRDQCKQAGIPFHFKQWGHWAPAAGPNSQGLPVRRFWDEVMGVEVFMSPKGKKVAGRDLDGVIWNGFPAAV